MFLLFLESACLKRIRQSKNGRFCFFLRRNCTRILYNLNYCSTDGPNVTQGQIAHNLETEHLGVCVSPTKPNPPCPLRTGITGIEGHKGIALRCYTKSPLMHLFEGGNEQVLLNCRTCAAALWAFNRRMEGKKERDWCNWMSWLIVLFWYWACRSVARAMALAFGLTSMPMYKWMNFSSWWVLYVLKYHPLLKVCKKMLKMLTNMLLQLQINIWF